MKVERDPYYSVTLSVWALVHDVSAWYGTMSLGVISADSEATLLLELSLP